jgi:hypothetical protein
MASEMPSDGLTSKYSPGEAQLSMAGPIFLTNGAIHLL